MWYWTSIAVYILGSQGIPAPLSSLPPVRGVAAWLAGGPEAIQAHHSLSAVCLLLLPIAILGAFAVLWPKRHLHLQQVAATGKAPHMLVEIGCLAFFTLCVWAVYLSEPSYTCVRCPRTGDGQVVMQALGMFLLPLVLYGMAITVYTRLWLLTIRIKARR